MVMAVKVNYLIEEMLKVMLKSISVIGFLYCL